MKQLRNTLCCLGIAVMGWGCALAARGAVTAEFSRYQVILDRNPFGEVAPLAVTATVSSLTISETFAKDYEMKAIIDDGDKIQVGILDKKTTKHIYLNVGQELNGLQLVSVNYDKEEAVMKMGAETAIIKLHPDKDKDKGATPALAGAGGLPSFGMPRKSPFAEGAPPFGASDQENTRKPFFTDLKRRGASPFQRMGTNSPFQAKGLESFFKPNTNMASPFISPFRPQSSPFRPVGASGASGGGQENPVPASPFTPVKPLDQGAGASTAGYKQQLQANPDQGYPQTVNQPATTPFNVPAADGEADGNEE